MRMLALGLGALLFAASTAFAQEAKSPVLFVDLQKVITECQEYQDLVEAAKKSQAAKQQEFEGEVKKLQDREKQLLETTLNDRNQAWFDELRKVQREAGELQAEINYQNALQADTIARKINSLMVGAQSESRKVMKERGAFIVFISKTGKIKLDTEAQFKDEIVRRRILVSDRGADITDAVLQRMNRWYENNKTAAGDVKERTEDGEKKAAPIEKKKS